MAFTIFINREISLFRITIFRECQHERKEARRALMARLDDIALALREKILLERFEGTPATLICWEVQHYSLPELDESELLIDLKRRPIRVRRGITCSRDLLLRIASAWDFQIGLLWALPLTETSNDAIINAISSFHSNEPDVICPEFLFSTDDGCTIVWSNPSVSESRIQESLIDFAKDHGCEVSLSPIPS